MKRTKRFLSLALAAIMVLSMSITAMAAEPATVTVSSDFDGNGTADYSWTIAGAVKAETMTMGSAKEVVVEGLSPGRAALADKQVTVYTIPVGAKVDITGSYGFNCGVFEVRDGKICTYGDASTKISEMITIEKISELVMLGGDKGYYLAKPGSYVSFKSEGYYSMAVFPFVPQYAVTDPNSPDVLKEKTENDYKYGYAILHVVSAEAAAALAAAAPAVSANPAASALTVEQIQKRFDGWYSNDLVAVNAAQGQNTVKTTVTNPVFISYNATANTVATLSNVQYTVSNGSITFTAPASGIIVISEGKLAK